MLGTLIVAELVSQTRRRQVSCVEVIQDTLERVDRSGDSYNCFINVLPERALGRARALDAAASTPGNLGPLHGVPISVKDNIDVEGVPTTNGSPIFTDAIADESARVVKLLEAAGAIVFAKNNEYDFGYCAPNPFFGPTHNPWDRTRSCAGSSSGSAAAVSAGLGFGSIGSDGGGSIRMPASLCGVVALKPTLALVPRDGTVPLHPTLSVTGPVGRTVDDCRLLLGSMILRADDKASRSFTGPRRYSSRRLDQLRIGIPTEQPEEIISSDMRNAFETTRALLEQAGAETVDVDLPDYALAGTMMWVISGAEAAEFLHPLLESDRVSEINPTTLALFRRGQTILAADYLRAQRLRQLMIRQMKEIHRTVDVVVLPTTPIPTYPIGASEVQVDDEFRNPLELCTQYTTLFNLTGQPAITLPCALSSEGLPLGVQVTGPPYSEDLLLDVADQLERLFEFKQPSLEQAQTSVA